MRASLADYDSDTPNAWCSGCGNFAILRAVKQALVELKLAPYQVLLVSGIGQAGKFPHYLNCNCFNVLHGRTLPVATGAKLANHALVVLAVGGDGDGYAEGGNHFLHTARRNIDITYLVHNNQVYGLTKGQASPTSDRGFVTRVTPWGVVGTPFNPMAIALAAGATFVARGFAAEVAHLTGLIVQAIRHPGFAFIDVLQPCVSFNPKNTYAWYRERAYKLEGSGHTPQDWAAAMAKAREWEERIPIGVLYQDTTAPPFHQHFPALKEKPLVKQRISPRGVASLVQEFI